MSTKKRIVILVALLVLVCAGQTMAQTTVLELFQLGKSTYEQVIANLPTEAKITGRSNDYDLTGGYAFATEGSDYGVEGLKIAEFGFDKKQTLASVGMFVKIDRLQEIKQHISSKYQSVSTKWADGSMVYKANDDFVIVTAYPSLKCFSVVYVTSAIYKKAELYRNNAEATERSKF